jgi:hypothetical protein
LLNAGEAISLYAESLASEGRSLPKPRAVSALRADPNVAEDLRDHVVALISFNEGSERAAK